MFFEDKWNIHVLEFLSASDTVSVSLMLKGHLKAYFELICQQDKSGS